jgi:hypothetical protein
MLNRDLITIGLIFIVIMVVYVFLQPQMTQHPLENYANPLMNNGIVADVIFRDNTDLDYAAARWGLQISEEEKRRTQQVAPILNPQSNSNYTSLWGNAPAAQNTARIPDRWSTMDSYTYPIVSVDQI